MKLVHAADLHLDSPLRGLDRYEGAPVERMRGATRRAFSALVDLCLDEEAALLLLAGDLFDGDWRDYATGLFFAAELTRLREGGVEVVWLRGNHDAASRLTKHLRLPPNARELGTRRPETIELPSIGVAVHGQGFARRDVTEDLAAAYPAPVPGALNVGLLHTALGGREGHAPYAPTRVEVLRQRGYDYWALGHVHTREVVSEDPWVVFPGNLQGRHLRELGPKGATLVHVRDGRIERVEPRALDVVRWAEVAADAAEAATADDALDLLRDGIERALDDADDRPLAVRLAVRGEGACHESLQRDRRRWEESARAVAIDVGRGGVWVADVRLETRAAGRDAAVRDLLGSAALERVVLGLEALAEDPAGLQALRAELAELDKRLPPELRQGEPAHALVDDQDALAAAVGEVARWLPARLLGARAAPADGREPRR